MSAWGIQLPVQSQSKLYAGRWETDAGPDEMAMIARVADEVGCDYLGICDHTAIPRRLADSMRTTWYDMTATIGWLAALTTRVRLLSHVLVLAQRHPLRATKELATLDVLSGGRLIIGVGAGHVEEEYALFGGEFPRRGAETDEALTALDLALREEFPTLPGPRWKAADMGIGPRPVQTPRPPIWIGGSSMAALRRTARFGDGWLPQGTPRAELPAQIAQLRDLRSEAGGGELAIGTIVEPIYLCGPGLPGDPDLALPDIVLKGAADLVTSSINDYVGMGVTHLQVRFIARSAEEYCDQMRAFAATAN